MKTLANVITNHLLTCFLSHPFILHVIISCNCFVNKFGILELLFYVCILGTNVVASESLQKQHKPPLSGLGKRDAGCIEYMTAYDKQLIDFTTIFYTKEYSSSWEQDEEALPHDQSLFIGGGARVIAMIRNLHCVLNTNTTTRNNIVPVEILESCIDHISFLLFTVS